MVFLYRWDSAKSPAHGTLNDYQFMRQHTSNRSALVSQPSSFALCRSHVHDFIVCLHRWGNAKSPAYGTLNDYQFMRRHTSSSKRAEKAKQCWGTSLNKPDDVNKVFVKYARGRLSAWVPYLLQCASSFLFCIMEHHLISVCCKLA